MVGGTECGCLEGGGATEEGVHSAPDGPRVHFERVEASLKHLRRHVVRSATHAPVIGFVRYGCCGEAGVTWLVCCVYSMLPIQTLPPRHQNHSLLPGVLGSHLSGEAKVGDLEDHGCTQKQVGKLEVSVDDVPGVDVSAAIHQLPHQVAHLRLRQTAPVS